MSPGDMPPGVLAIALVLALTLALTLALALEPAVAAGLLLTGDPV